MDNSRYAQKVVHANSTLSAMINRVRRPRLALSTFMSSLRSFEFCKGRPDFVLDTSTQSLQEPCADERERAIGFLRGKSLDLELLSFNDVTFLVKA